MGRMNFGGAQDLSGVFAALQERYANKVEADVANAKNRAQQDQAAEDKEIYAKWKAGKISDDEWLAHLAKRRDNALEPEERSEYSELFLEHTGAIADSQMEARFAMGEVSLGALMKHYTTRMGAVNKESPAWRELAQRYGQLSQSAQSGGGGGGGGRRSGGSSGGGGRRGGGSGAGTGDGMAAGMDVLAGGMFKGINTAGDDLVDPTMSMVPIADDDDFINALMSDIERIKQLEDWMKEHPGDNTVIDEMTGEEFVVDADFLIELDKQYIRTEQALAATYFARGGSENVKKGNQALGHATNWVTGPMTRHNTIKAEPHMRQIEQHVFAQMVGASKISDPNERKQAYAMALKDVDRWIRGHLTQGGKEIADALRPSDEIFARATNLRELLDLGANSDQYTPEQINAIADGILSRSTTLGEGSTVSIQALLEGPAGTVDSGLPDDFVGLLETMTQAQGLAAGERLMAGNPDPEYDGPLYVYQYDGQGEPRAVVADVRDQANSMGGVSPVLVPQGGDPAGLIMTRVKVGGSVQTVWVEPQPVDDPRFRVYRGADGNLLSSQAIAEMGAPRLQALVAMGQVQVDSVLTAVKLPDGNVWFRDNETGLFHLEPPVTVTRDEITNGVQVDAAGEVVINAVPHAKGVIVPFAGVSLFDMGRWIRSAEQAGILNPMMYRQRGAGGEVVELDWLNDKNSMYEPVREPGQRLMNPQLREHLRARARSSEEEFMRAPQYARQLNAPTTPEELEAHNIRRTQSSADTLGIKIGGPGSLTRGSPGTRTAPGGMGSTRSGLAEMFGNPKQDATEAFAARNKVPKVWTGWAAPKTKPADVSFAPPPVTRAPLPLLRITPIDRPMPAAPAPAPRPRPTTDTPSVIGTKSPAQRGNRNQEIL